MTDLQRKKEMYKKWRLENIEHLQVWHQKYRFRKDGTRTAKFNKSMKISNWRGKPDNPIVLMENETWDDVYKLYMDCTDCMGCGCSFSKKIRKNLDHCHRTGYIRGILCSSCNHYRVDVFKDMF